VESQLTLSAITLIEELERNRDISTVTLAEQIEYDVAGCDS
jgi:hypothetical protein